jgi:quercetin dioxygenase-like cupin family protein
MAAMYQPDEGEEIAPGVRMIKLTEKPSYIDGYGTISMRDIVWQPGAKTSNPSMPNDMVCHTIEGNLHIDNGGGDEFEAPQGQVWSCAKGQMEAVENRTDAPGVMRVIDLIEA